MSDAGDARGLRDIREFFRAMLAGRGEMGCRVVTHPWASTPLGEPGVWPQSLRSSLDICLALSPPAGLFWGADFIFFYNDALRGLIGEKHPGSLGQRGPDVFPEAWSTIGPMLCHVLETGEAIGEKDQQLFLNRRGAVEECYFDYTFSAIRRKDGSVGGIFILAFETTERVLAERGLRESEARYRAFVHATSNSLYRMSADGTKLLEVTGSLLQPYDAATSADPPPDYVHPSDREKTDAAWLQAVRTQSPYEMEFRGRRLNGSYGWILSRAVPVRDEQGRVIEWLGSATDISHRKHVQESNEVLINELQHRTRNLLAVVRSITRQILKSSKTQEDFITRLDDRLGALSRVQRLLSRPDTAAVSIAELVRLELAALGAEENDRRIVMHGPEIPLPYTVVQTLALALHELSTNALKYGALASPHGTLEVTWQVQPGTHEHHLVLVWVEHGITKPKRGNKLSTRRGYGRELIERALPYQLNAHTKFELNDDGVYCCIDVPLRDFESGQKHHVAIAS
jgi:two-component sensor histidine kinase